jgi:hypothetical protein
VSVGHHNEGGLVAGDSSLDPGSIRSVSPLAVGKSVATRPSLIGRHVAWGVATVVLISGAIAALTAPGKFSPDSLDQYNQALHNSYTDWHTPILTGLWGFLDTPPEFVLLLFITMVLVSSMLLVASETTVWWAVFAVTIVALWPMTFEVLVTIGKDAWSAGFFFSGAALSAWTLHLEGRRRLVALLVVGGLWWLAVAARPNAIVPIFLVVAFGWPLALGRERQRWWSRRGLKRLGMAAAYVVFVLLSQSIYTSVVVQPKETHPEQPVYLYDLAGLSLRTDEMLVPPSARTPGADLATLREHWSEGESYGLFFGPDAPLRWALRPPQVAELRRAWLEAIKDHPVEYLALRTRYGLTFLGFTKPSYGVFLPRTTPEGWGFDYSIHSDYAPWFTGWYDRTFREGGVFSSFRQWMFIAVLLAVGLTSRGRRSVAVRTLMAAALGTTFSFLVAAPAAGFRYAWFTMLCSLLAATIGLFWTAQWLRLRSEASTSHATTDAHLNPHDTCSDATPAKMPSQ